MAYGNMRTQGERDVRGAMLLDKIAEAENVQVEDSEELNSLARTFRWPALSAVAAAALLALLGLGSSPAGLAAISLCVFVTITIGLEFAPSLRDST